MATELRETRSGLVIPVEVRPVFVRCRICNTGFAREQAYDGGPYERHVVDCAKQNEQVLAESSLKHKMPALYGDEAGDPELEHYVREHAQAILDGRVRI